MSYLRRFGQFWWNFVVGDNLPLALGAGAAIGVTALLVHEGINAWWLLPTSILALLAISVLRAADPDNPFDALRRKHDTDALQARARSTASRHERQVGAYAPESLGADTETARLLGDASMADVERLGD